MIFHYSNHIAEPKNILTVCRRIIKIILMLVMLSACTSPAPSITAIPLTATVARPSATIPPTASPTVTPTQTSVPKLFGKCPMIQEDLVPDFKNAFEQTNGQDFVTPVLAFLNQGGSPQAVINAFQKAEQSILNQDLTGDGVNELVVFDRSLTILGCVSQKYEVLTTVLADFGRNDIISKQDMNLNGIPDMVVYNSNSCGFMWNCSEAYIYEWDGKQFQNIVENDYYGIVSMHGVFDAKVIDIDGNGTQELVVDGGIPTWFADYADGLPWREQIDTYMWKGRAFVLDRTEFSAPEYRFQAVQDGDRATLRGDYEKALGYYQQAISKNALGWWTSDREVYEESQVTSSFDPQATPLPKPVRDPAEKPSLAAYAQYRLILLYLVQNMDAEAQTAYKTLVKRYPEGQTGNSYVEMATVFWNDYQLNSDLARACSKAIEYASAHPEEILSYLGNTSEQHYHGWQSLEYSPTDICPFDK